MPLASLIAPPHNHDTISRHQLMHECALIQQRLATLHNLAAHHPAFLDLAPLKSTASNGPLTIELPRFIFLGPQTGADPLRIAIFAGLHGDEPEGVLAALELLERCARQPALAEGYCLYVYPLCNPTGLAAGTRESASGRDLNREFWRGSAEPEVQLLEAELRSHRLHGLIALHTDDTSPGFYGYASGASLSEHLLPPALAAAEKFVPLNRATIIDGFPARDGIIREGFPGVLHGPPDQSPQPFDVILESPRAGALPAKLEALAQAVLTLLAEYRQFIAYAANL
ncbi:MAG: succinylglutamate desuccinylase/aspartoacylase family protein [Verrucomicrobiae bacterium]|nr:succinylglutamate desuccinylase/aspartoacylase family protein [Verrucomicrobiae bacterium]